MKIYRMDKNQSEDMTSEEKFLDKIMREMTEIRSEEEQEKVMDKIIREERAKKLEMNNITKKRRKITKRLTKEINDEFNIINFSLDNIIQKTKCLKKFETKYNTSIPEKIILLIKNLKMLDSDYLRDKEEEI